MIVNGTVGPAESRSRMTCDLTVPVPQARQNFGTASLQTRLFVWIAQHQLVRDTQRNPRGTCARRSLRHARTPKCPARGGPTHRSAFWLG